MPTAVCASTKLIDGASEVPLVDPGKGTKTSTVVSGGTDPLWRYRATRRAGQS
jgi:hypothetical protein